MHELYSCVIDQHDLRLVALAAIICLLGVYSTFGLGRHALATSRPGERRLWGACAILCSASSTWATHFIAMLAFHPGAPAGFDPVLTAASFVIALTVIGSGIALLASAASSIGRAGCGVVIGLGISLMHYVGMAAYGIPGVALWHPLTVAASIAASIVFAAIGAALAFVPVSRARHLAPAVMVLAICSLHFTGMSAVTLVYDPARDLPPNIVQPGLLSAIVAIVACLILGLSAACLLLIRANRRRYWLERQRLGELTDVALEGLLICEGDRIVSANQSVAALCGREAEALVGLDLGELLEGLHASAVSELVEIDAQLGAIPVKVLRRQIVVRKRPHNVIAVRDQRERIRTEAQIRALAFSDTLTGLPNRAKFQAELDTQITSRRKGDGAFALMMIDLDRFKPVNDTLGHGVGDVVLKRTAARLRAAVRDYDVVARLGGDEFALLQVGVTTEDEVRAVAARIIDLISRPFLINGHVVNIGASVGVALAPADGDTPEALLRNADLAAYHAKEAGRGTFRMFESGLDARMHERRRLEQDLRRAVACREFEVFYQPQMDAKSGSVTGAEALVRWRDPTRGLISPADFIPLAEETGLIANIGEWVLRTACAEAVKWPAHMTIAVNISPVQFRDVRLSDMVKSALASTGLAPNRLELEITEGVLMIDETRTLATLNELRSCGIRISMDDFGTGYSSLSYLRRFPFDKIKVDQSFVRQLPADPESVAIVRAILTMGACLGLGTTVEGVETAEQLEFSAAEGCNQVQGYLLSRPLDAAAMTDFISLQRAA